MINLNSFSSLGQSGMEMMQKSLNTANAAGTAITESGADPMTIAAASMDLSAAKVQMAVGAWMVKTQNELMESSLAIFGIGTKHDGLY